jgi:hypothetical protein
MIGHIKKYENEDIKHDSILIEKNIGIITNLAPYDIAVIFATYILKNNKIIKRPRIHYATPFICLKDLNNINVTSSNLIIVNDLSINIWNTYLTSINEPFIILSQKGNYDEDLSKETRLFILCYDTAYKKYYDTIKLVRWNRIILDECESLKLPSTISWNCNFVWITTKNPDILYYSAKDFLSPINKISNYQLFTYLTLNSTNIIKDNSKFVTTNIIACKPSTDLNSIDNNVMELLECKKYDTVLNILNITSYSNKIIDEDCGICYRNKKYILTTPCCKKHFCIKCLVTSLYYNTNCPTCRTNIIIQNIVSNVDPMKIINQYKTKKEWINDFISNNKTGIFVNKYNYWINYFTEKKIDFEIFDVKKLDLYNNNKYSHNYIMLNIKDHNKWINSLFYNYDKIVFLDDITLKEDKIISNKLLYVNNEKLTLYKLK